MKTLIYKLIDKDLLVKGRFHGTVPPTTSIWQPFVELNIALDVTKHAHIATQSRKREIKELYIVLHFLDTFYYVKRLVNNIPSFETIIFFESITISTISTHVN